MYAAQCVPGDKVGTTASHRCGVGTYESQGVIFSSLVGTRHEQRDADGNIEVSVRGKEGGLTPAVNDVVLAQVTKVDRVSARCRIVAVGGVLVRGQGFGAMIRIQDVRATETEKVEIQKSFRPGDIVRAIVLSLGDRRHYYLSTQRNDLGVVGAKCALSGVAMVPISWESMKCPVTGVVEFRKVAQTVQTTVKQEEQEEQ